MKPLKAGAYVFTVQCPECERSQTIPAEFGARLTVDINGGRLALRMSTKSLEHDCNSNGETVLPLFPADDPDVDE